MSEEKLLVSPCGCPVRVSVCSQTEEAGVGAVRTSSSTLPLSPSLPSPSSATRLTLVELDGIPLSLSPSLSLVSLLTLCAPTCAERKLPPLRPPPALPSPLHFLPPVALNLLAQASSRRSPVHQWRPVVPLVGFVGLPPHLRPATDRSPSHLQQRSWLTALPPSRPLHPTASSPSLAAIAADCSPSLPSSAPDCLPPHLWQRLRLTALPPSCPLHPTASLPSLAATAADHSPSLPSSHPDNLPSIAPAASLSLSPPLLSSLIAYLSNSLPPSHPDVSLSLHPTTHPGIDPPSPFRHPNPCIDLCISLFQRRLSHSHVDSPSRGVITISVGRIPFHHCGTIFTRP